MTRDAAVQRCPEVPNADQTMPSSERSTSASSRTTIAFFPPSSQDTRFRSRPPISLMCEPVSDDPVNEMRSTPGCETRWSPSSPPDPSTRLMTPFGSPASSSISTRRTAISGVYDAGLNTTVLPRMSAGMIFQVGIANGKFQGVIAATTPTGCRMDIAAGFGEHLAHLARHLAREVVLAGEHDLAGPVEDLAALWGRVEAPAIEGAPG